MSVRVRPTKPGDPCAVTTDPRTGALALASGDVFQYPSSVVVGSDQDLAYDALCAPLVRHALTGYDCTLVAYGQTGSGKTHTMFGPPGCLVEARVRQWHEESSSSSSSSSDAPRDWGVFPRAVLELMRTPGVRSIRASAVEVYHENVFDLMNARAQLSLGSSRTKFGRVCLAPPRAGATTSPRAAAWAESTLRAARATSASRLRKQKIKECDNRGKRQEFVQPRRVRVRPEGHLRTFPARLSKTKTSARRSRRSARRLCP